MLILVWYLGDCFGQGTDFITVGAGSGVIILSALLLWLFLRLRNRAGPESRTSEAHTESKEMDSDQSSENYHFEPDMKGSLISGAMPVAGRSDAEAASEGADNQPPSRGTLAGLAAVTRKPLGSIFRRPQPSRGNPEAVFDDDAHDGPGSAREAGGSGAADAELEGPEQDVDDPSQANTNCPIQRLQDRFRPHNSTDPRPSRPPAPRAAVDRDSVASASSCGSRCSSRVNSRFSFGLLLQPSLDLFKFKDVRTSTGSPRGSGWSLWFR